MALSDPQERAHYESVLMSFREYESYLLREIFRRKRSLQRLSANHAKLLPKPNSTLHSLHRFINAAHANQLFLERIVQEQLRSGPVVDLPTINPRANLQSPPRHLSKLKSTLHQFGEAEREQCYRPILDELEKVLPVSDKNRNKQKVLVPGAGLGRLTLEIAAKGYATQGNEFSYQMLFASNFILNCISNKEEFTIHPWIHNSSNHLSVDDALRSVAIPDVVPGSLFALNHDNVPDFSMCAGEFLEAYSKDTACWDCIVTCFFIDAAPNVIEYIEAIRRLLRPGGVWINLGPLLYHWQSFGDSDANDDPRYAESIELSHEELKVVMKRVGFTIQREEVKECVYTRNIKSLMHTTYNCVFFTALRQ
ncbi:unnamed protein product [Albugo candida]|uniref:carnosine N-methyltransferase n=2 Tax=Albugo candida TaxID=65357 RepID=A0A024GLD8_9STRA|nr:unnamed protein product [Albugo candida]|eukprot:CCI47157.1 unnamed protein product [Albugo candida]